MPIVVNTARRRNRSRVVLLLSIDFTQPVPAFRAVLTSWRFALKLPRFRGGGKPVGYEFLSPEQQICLQHVALTVPGRWTKRGYLEPKAAQVGNNLSSKVLARVECNERALN